MIVEISLKILIRSARKYNYSDNLKQILFKGEQRKNAQREGERERK